MAKECEALPLVEAMLLKENSINLVRRTIAWYTVQLKLGLEIQSPFLHGHRRLAKKQLTALQALLDQSQVSIQAREYRPNHDASGCEVVFVSKDAQEHVASAGLYVDTDRFTHIAVGDGWSSVINPSDPDGTKYVMENQAMKEFFLSGILTEANVGPVIRGTQLPSMVSVGYAT